MGLALAAMCECRIRIPGTHTVEGREPTPAGSPLVSLCAPFCACHKAQISKWKKIRYAFKFVFLVYLPLCLFVPMSLQSGFHVESEIIPFSFRLSFFPEVLHPPVGFSNSDAQWFCSLYKKCPLKAHALKAGSSSAGSNH